MYHNKLIRGFIHSIFRLLVLYFLWLFDLFIDIDECLSISCLNGGTCINLVGGFMCECPPGFRGDTCGIGESEILNKNVFLENKQKNEKQ